MGERHIAESVAHGPVPGYERTRAYRHGHPDHAEREKRRNAARQRALVLLARRYPEDFRELYTVELVTAGLGARAAHIDGDAGA